jgi:O-antigen/teichoic acid export membrane protein
MGLIQRIVGALLGLAFLAAVFVFASLALGVLIAGALVLWAWLWWRSRSLRPPARDGAVVEGEYRDLTRYD